MNHGIPTYALYGEAGRPLVQESLHCESIAQRSRLYEWEIRLHRHELFAQVLHIRDGTGVAMFGDQAFEMVGPCVAVVAPLAPHGFTFSSDVDGSVVTVVAQDLPGRLSATPELLDAFHGTSLRLLERGTQEALQVDAAIGALVSEFHGNAPWRAAAIDAALSLALLVIGRAVKQAPANDDTREAGPGPRDRGMRHLKRFLDALEQGGYREPRSVDSYAAPLGITPTQLNRLCRRVLGRSALQTVHARVMLEAERDLAYTSMSVKEIALSLGFSDAAYFTRFFARQRGSSPSEFRRAAREHLAGR